MGPVTTFGRIPIGEHFEIAIAAFSHAGHPS